MKRDNSEYVSDRKVDAVACPIPIWQECAEARWLISVASDRQEQEPWSGWFDINADAKGGIVEMCGVDFTPDEARSAARALIAAADHVELFVHRATSPLFELISGGRWPEIDHLPTETQRMIRDAVGAAIARIRTSHENHPNQRSEGEL